MDAECVALCEALNKLPGIQTTASCCGHGVRSYRIFFAAENLEALPPLLYWLDNCHCGFAGWHVLVTTDCAMSPAHFCIENKNGGQIIYGQANEIASLIKAEVLEICPCESRIT